MSPNPPLSFLARLLVLLLFSVVLLFSARADKLDETAGQIVQTIRAVLPKGWKADYEKEFHVLSVTRKERVMASFYAPSLPAEDNSELQEYSFSFRVVPFVSQTELQRLQNENEKTWKQISALREQFEKRRGGPSKGDSFDPLDENEKKEIAHYEALKKSLHSIPDFHFRNVALEWLHNSPEASMGIAVHDDTIREECNKVRETVVKVFSKYDGK